MFTSQPAFAITTSEVFRSHPNRIFIESGSYRGDGIQNALDAGFEEIYSIELSPHLYHHCCKRFAGNKRVHLYFGDSSNVLSNILDEIDEPVTFWLDGHYSWGDTAKGNSNTPILNELAAIAEHHINTHTILIDDVRQFGAMEFDFIDENTILRMLLQINPDYRIYYQDGYQKNDVLVAEI
jgi:hypothetical protein